MAEILPTIKHKKNRIPARFITLDDLGGRFPAVADTLTGLWPGDMNIVELKTSMSLGKISPENRPPYLNKPIGLAIRPSNFNGDVSDGVVVFLEIDEADLFNVVNVAYGVTLNPPVRGIAGAAIKVQYRKNPQSKEAKSLERELIPLNFNEDEQKAFMQLAEDTTDYSYRVALHGILRAVDDSAPFAGPPLADKILRHDARDL